MLGIISLWKMQMYTAVTFSKFIIYDLGGIKGENLRHDHLLITVNICSIKRK